MNKFSTFISIILLIIAGSFIINAPLHSLEGTEYQIKAAMMVNFIQFVQWPEDDPDESADFLTIGIFGADNFGSILDSLNGRIVNEKQIKLLRINSTKELRQCQVVFVPESESNHTDEILAAVNGFPVLTIGETDRFIQQGGIIRFFIEQNHVRFEINRTAAYHSKLKISAKLMEIARVVD
jgi:hypothetical protein